MNHPGDPYTNELLARLEREEATRTLSRRAAIGSPARRPVRASIASALRATANRVDPRPESLGPAARAHHNATLIGPGFPR